MIAHSQLAPLPIELPFRITSKTIGQGAYACIKKAAPPKTSTPIFAVKFIHKDYAIRHGRLTKKQLDMEISLHKLLGAHDHIVQFYDAGEDQTWRWIAMELAEGGDLFDKIESDVGVGEEIAHLYFLQLISAVGYMHQKGIGHRDIKPENILLSAEGDLKIADFGLATLFEYNGQKKLCTTSCGSPPYTAPEVVTCDHRIKKRLDQGYQGNLVDIWSCAVVLFVLLVGNTPWDEPLDRSYEFDQYVNSIGRPDDELWHKLPDDTIDLLRGMMDVDPSKRMSLEQAQGHPWVRRRNAHLNSKGTLQNPLQVATQMFETMKIDFSQDPTVSQRSQRCTEDTMDIDNSSDFGIDKSVTGPNLTNEIMFDRETRVIDPGDRMSPSKPHSLFSQRNLDDTLAEEPSCSQFSSTPRVPLTRTQFARQFRDILPSHSLTRFFSLWPAEQLEAALRMALLKLGISIVESAAPLTEPSTDARASIKIKSLDSRQCPISGYIVVETLPGVEGSAVEANFIKAKGDPLEWRRLFKNVVLLSKDAVFRPDESVALFSQTSTG